MRISKDFRVGFLDVNSNLKMKNSAILNVFGEVAGVHSEKIGDSFASSKFHWILSAYKVNIIRRPSHGEDISVTTWSAGYTPAIAAREFEVRDKKGNLIITAMSSWVLINYDTMRLEKITPKYMNPYEEETEYSNFSSTRLKKLEVPDEYTLIGEMSVDWKWIDLNQHMNNTYYPEIAEHFLPEDVRKLIADKSFEIYYKKEIPEGSNIKCLYTKTEDAHTITLKNTESSTIHAIIRYQ